MTADERLARAVGLYEEAIDRFSEVHRLMQEEMDFALYLDHYEDEAGANKSPDRVQPRGREVKQLVTHIAAQVSKSKFYFDVRPVDSDEVNAELAEVVKGAIESEIYNPTKDFEGARERAILQAVSSRMGYVAIEYDRSIGPWGEVLFRNGDGRRLIWAKGHASPHDPRCPRVMEILRVPVDEVRRRKWKNNEDVFPDSDYLDQIAPVSGTRDRLDDTQKMNGEVTVCWLWERNLEDTREVERNLEPLPEGKRFLKCAHCGMQGDTQEQVGYELPEGAPCPACGEMAMRQDAMLESDVELANRKGKRLTIFAPNARRVFVELNEWPHDLPTVPYVIYKWEDHPLDAFGVSLTHEHWTMQLAADMHMRLGLETMMLARPYTLQPRGQIQDYSGNEWAFDPSQGLNMYYNGSMPVDKAIHMIQAAGLPPSWATLDQSIQGRFNAHTGTSDIAMTPQNSKDIPASTLAQYIEQGELPVQHFITRCRRADTVGVQILYHLIRKTWTTPRWVEFQQDGAKRAQLVAGDDLPNYNVVVTANPEVARIDNEEIQAWMTFMQMPPEGQEFVAKRLNIPISEVRKMQEQRMLMQQQMLSQQVSQLGGMVPPETNGSTDVPPEMRAQIEQLTGQAQRRF